MGPCCVGGSAGGAATSMPELATLPVWAWAALGAGLYGVEARWPSSLHPKDPSSSSVSKDSASRLLAGCRRGEGPGRQGDQVVGMRQASQKQHEG